MPLFLALIAASVSLATTFVEQPFPESVQESPIIVRGKVGMRYADWSVGKDGQKRIYTYTELKVDEALKGKVSGQNLMMRELGGEKDGIGMQVAGSAEFERGEDVVVFLNPPNPDGTYTVQNMMMGKYNVRQDSNGQDVIEGAGMSSLTHPALRGKEHLIHPGEGHEESHGDTAPTSKYTLQGLRELIREHSQAVDDKAQPRETLRPSPVAPSAAPSPLTTAPPLQPSPPEAPVSPWAMVVGALAVLSGAFLFLRRLLRK